MLTALSGLGFHCREASFLEVAAALRTVQFLELLLLARDGLDVRFCLIDLMLASLILLLNNT